MNVPFVLLLLVISLCSRAQTDRSIEKELLATKDIHKRVNIYLSAISENSQNQDSLKYWYTLALKDCQKSHFRLGEGKIMGSLATIDKSKGHMTLAKERTQFALSIFKEYKDTVGISDMLGNLGAIEASTGNYEPAAKYILEAIKLNDIRKNNYGQTIAYTNLASIYLSMGDTTNTERYLDIAKELAKKDGGIGIKTSIGNMYGILNAMKGNNEAAIKIFLDNLKEAEKFQSMNAYVECLSYIGQYYIDNGATNKAIEYLKKGLDVTQRKTNLEELRSNILGQLSDILSATNPKEALGYVNESIEIAKRMNNRSFLSAQLQERSALYKKLGKYDAALNDATESRKIHDSMASVKKAVEISSLVSAYELEKTSEEIKVLEEASIKSLKERNTLIAVLAILATSFVVIIVFFINTRKLNKQLKLNEHQLEESNAMKNKLFSIISHDLRGPIAQIPALVDVLQSADVNAEERKWVLDNMKTHGKGSLEMLDKLLLWGKTLVSGNTIVLDKVNVLNNVSDCISLNNSTITAKELSTEINIVADIEVMCNKTHFDIIMRNLISNAIKYSEKGGIISIGLAEEQKPGYTTIYVKDNGIGMTTDELSTLFSPTNSKPGTAQEQGSGIGLMLCKEFSAMNGGTIWAESKHEKGTTFYCSFKRA